MNNNTYILTGQTNKEFVAWITDKENETFNEWYFHTDKDGNLMFYETYITKMPWYMVYGLFIKFFESKEYLIDVSPIDSHDSWQYAIYVPGCLSPFDMIDNEYEFDYREEAEVYAVEKLNELNNKQFDHIENELFGEEWKKELMKWTKKELFNHFGVNGENITKQVQIEIIRLNLIEKNKADESK